MVFITFIMQEYVGSLRQGEKMNEDILKTGLIFTGCVSIWSLMYFVQLVPSIGQFVNCIRRMLGIMFNFIIVYPYPHAFMVMLKDYTDCQVPGFETVSQGVYS